MMQIFRPYPPQAPPGWRALLLAAASVLLIVGLFAAVVTRQSQWLDRCTVLAADGDVRVVEERPGCDVRPQGGD